MATRVITGATIPLLEGGVYRALVKTGNILASAGALQSKFEDLGFSGVVVYADAASLPADWPTEARSIATSGLERGYFAQGTWGKPNDSLPRPDEIVAIWLQRAPARRSVDYGSLAPQARSEFRQAWAFEFPGTKPSPEAEQAILAIGYFEGKWGYPGDDPAWHGSNNWGAVKDAAASARTGSPPATDPEPDCGPTAFVHIDHDANGKAYWGCFRRYPTMREGARDLIRVLHRMPHAWASIDSGSATKLADAMHADRYFELAPGKYATGLYAAAKEVARLTGDRLVVKLQKGRGWLWAGGFAVAGIGTGGAWWYQRKRAPR